MKTLPSQETMSSNNVTIWPYQNTQGLNDMVMSTNIVDISKALLAAQKNMGAALKDSKNPFFKSKYADLNAVREAAQPALQAEGIVVLQPMVQKDTKSYVRTLLVHASTGQYIGSDTEVVCAKANDPQAYGSAITYARRYGLQTLVSLGAEDDDSEGAMNRTKTSSTSTTETTSSTTKKSSFRKPQTSSTEEKVDGWE